MNLSERLAILQQQMMDGSLDVTQHSFNDLVLLDWSGAGYKLLRDWSNVVTSQARTMEEKEEEELLSMIPEEVFEFALTTTKRVRENVLASIRAKFELVEVEVLRPSKPNRVPQDGPSGSSGGGSRLKYDIPQALVDEADRLGPGTNSYRTLALMGWNPNQISRVYGVNQPAVRGALTTKDYKEQSRNHPTAYRLED